VSHLRNRLASGLAAFLKGQGVEAGLGDGDTRMDPGALLGAQTALPDSHQKRYRNSDNARKLLHRSVWFVCVPGKGRAAAEAVAPPSDPTEPRPP
jgi:hypothetical protein